MMGSHIHSIADGGRENVDGLVLLRLCVAFEVSTDHVHLLFGEFLEPSLVTERTLEAPGPPSLVPDGTGELSSMEVAAVLRGAALFAQQVMAADSRATRPERQYSSLVVVVPVRLSVQIIMGVNPWSPAGRAACS